MTSRVKIGENLITQGYVYQTFLESKEGSTVYYGLDEVIDNAIDATEDGGIIKLDYNPETNTIIIFDNGSGMDYDTLKGVLSNASYHKKDGNKVGIRGVGLKKFVGIVGNLSGCTLNILTSIGNKFYSKGTMFMSPNDETILHPKIDMFDSNGIFEDNDVNIQNGYLKGTIIELQNCEPISFTDEVLNQYAIKYAEPILIHKKKIIINGVELQPIDPTYTIGKTIDKPFVVDNENRLYYTSFHFNMFKEGREDVTYPLDIMSVQLLDPQLIKEKYPFEESAGFNYFGGVYTKRGGRFLDYGNNTCNMFALPVGNPYKRNNKTTSMYGQTVGHLAGYNRIIINLDNNEVAKIFGIQSIKSKGILSLYDNKNITKDYFVMIDNVKVSVFQAISYIRKFNDYFYVNVIKHCRKTYDWNNLGSDLNMLLKNYSFAFGKPLVSTKDVIKVANTIRMDKIYTYSIKDRSCFLSIQWQQNKHNNKGKIIRSEINKDCILYKLLEKDEVRLRKLYNLFIADFKCCTFYSFFDREAIKAYLVGKTNQYLEVMNDSINKAKEKAFSEVVPSFKHSKR